MEKEIIEQILQGLLNAEEYKPVFKKLMVIIHSYSKEMKPYLEHLNNFIAELSLNVYQKAVNAGMSSEDALSFVAINRDILKNITKEINENIRQENKKNKSF